MIGFYTGVRRGAALQLLYTLGYCITFICARLFYKPLGDKLELLIPYPTATEHSQMLFFDQETAIHLDKSFYAGVGFICILFIGWVIVRFLGIFFYQYTFVPIKQVINFWVGGFLGWFMMYIGIFFVLYLFSLIPISSIQDYFSQSALLRSIVKYTPYFSKLTYKLWITQII